MNKLPREWECGDIIAVKRRDGGVHIYMQTDEEGYSIRVVEDPRLYSLYLRHRASLLNSLS